MSTIVLMRASLRRSREKKAPEYRGTAVVRSSHRPPIDLRRL